MNAPCLWRWACLPLACLCAVSCPPPALAWSPPPESSLQRADLRVHRIVEGDTPRKIERLYKLKPERWAALNGLDPANPALRLGKGLLLPDGPTTRHLPRHLPPTPWSQPWGRCEAQPWPSLARVDELTPVWCAQGSPDVKLCLDAERSEAWLQARGERWVWESSVFLGDASATVAPFWLNLDDDPARELVVAVLEASSNGIGVEYWSLAVFDDLDHAGPPLRFRVEEFGPASLLDGGAGRCELLLTRWERAADPVLGEGLYFFGQRARVQTPSLELALVPGLAARRYDGSEAWEGKYGADLERVDTAKLLSGPGVRAWGVDPWVSALSPRRYPAQVASAELKGDSWDLRWKVRLKRASAADPAPPAEREAQRLGDDEFQSLYPEAYAPPGFGASLQRRGVVWQPRADGELEGGVLWLAPAER